jgi:hypothetical protein
MDHVLVFCSGLLPGGLFSSVERARDWAGLLGLRGELRLYRLGSHSAAEPLTLEVPDSPPLGIPLPLETIEQGLALARSVPEVFLWTWHERRSCWPTAVFDSKETAVVSSGGREGLLTRYPLNIPAFILEVAHGYLVLRREVQRLPERIARCSGGSMHEHLP